ncbi:hypothetical protein KW784_01810 [Candidatus Parcubacteria bacterium]|nr:hypothetical protein [Candidatus Parcubacteria bacterium]
MRFPYSLSGMILFPALVGVVFLFQIKFLATPVFLPLIAVYKIFGSVPEASGKEFAFILLYWSFTGFLVGLILDLCTRPSPYSPAPRPPL